MQHELLKLEHLTTGIEELDHDHEILVTMIQGLLDALKGGTRSQTGRETLERLQKYSIDHFEHEARLMAQYGFPEEPMLSHKAEHEILLSRIEGWQRQMDATGGSTRTVFDMAGYLLTWFTHHIQGHDMQLAHFMRSVRA